MGATGQLAGLQVSRKGSDPLVYYCPMGSRLNALPGHVPFSIDTLSNRVVSVQHLAMAVQRTARLCLLYQHVAPQSENPLFLACGSTQMEGI